MPKSLKLIKIGGVGKKLLKVEISGVSDSFESLKYFIVSVLIKINDGVSLKEQLMLKEQLIVYGV